MKKQIFYKMLCKIIWALSPILVLMCCSKDNDEIKPARKLSNVMPSIVKIGDNVNIEGTGLNCPTCYITFDDEVEFESISVSENQIVAVVPTLFNEEVSIILWEGNVPQDTAAINLIVFFPLHNSPTFAEPWGMQAIDGNTFFAYGEYGLFRTDSIMRRT